MYFLRKIPGLVAMIILLVAASSFGQNADDITFTTQSPEALRYFLSGLDLTDNFRYADAAVMFEKAVKADPEFAIAYDYWAATATSTEDYLTRLNKAVELAPKASESERLAILADQAMNDNKPELARENYRKLVALFPNGKRAHLFYASFLGGRQEYADAEREYNKAISIDPGFAVAYNQLSYLLAYMEKYPEAIKALQKYAELKPEEPNPHDSMGEIYLWMGDYDNSMKEYGNSLKIDPNFTPSIAGLGHNLVFKGEYANGRAKYNEILAHAKSVGDTTGQFYWTAVSYLHEKNLDKAIETFKDELSFVKARNDIYSEISINGTLGYIYMEKGDFDNAMKQVAVVRELAAGPQITSNMNKSYLRNCIVREANILAHQGKNDEAKAKLAEYLNAIEPKDDLNQMQNYHALAGLLAYYRKDYPTAISELKQGVPDEPYYKYYLGLSYEKAGQKEPASKTFAELASYNRNGMEYSMVRPEAIAKIK